ncbi:MAG: hypothetical protein IPF99_25165 [Deltaproteobacteria bacterium]|jgi:hypothetical protein|nr:hypothetical protein [Deltaproteobacteria bacterium]MBP6831918.1 hypothetical protein [Deltaproteobacteria bacterium]
MIDESWGLLARERAGLTRRTRGLGLGAAVRAFNELAVPGIGGVWFARPLAWAVLGIRLARGRSFSAVSVANAIEALACWHARADPDSRVRGRTMLAGVPNGFVSFREAARRGFYVTQPMRQGTVQALRGLGLVHEGPQRFNAYQLTEAGERLVELAYESFRPKNDAVDAVLAKWIEGGAGVHTESMRAALDPRAPLPERAREFLRERVARWGPDAPRRAAVIAWLRKPDRSASWAERPPLIDVEHWRDLRVGARFFDLQRAALAVLDGAEAIVRTAGSLRLAEASTEPMEPLLEELSARASAFLDENHTPVGAENAVAFATEVRNTDRAAGLRSAVERDGRGLLIDHDRVLAGPVFRRQPPAPNASKTDDSEDDDGGGTPEPTGALPLPEGISRRVRSLHTLDLDLDGRLGGWLSGAAEAE